VLPGDPGVLPLAGVVTGVTGVFVGGVGVGFLVGGFLVGGFFGGFVVVVTGAVAHVGGMIVSDCNVTAPF
jgi:hypothetical protein